MRRIYFLAVMLFALLSTTVVFGQSGKSKKVIPNLDFGIKAGLNIEQMRGDKTIDTNFKLGGIGGLFLSVHQRHIGGRVEALVKTVRYHVYNAGYIHVRTVSLDVPFLFDYVFFDRLHVLGGPQLTALISAKRANGVDVKNNFKNADFSAVLGAEVDLPFRLSVGLRIIQGFVNVNNTKPSAKWKNSSAQLTVGFRFVHM
jgi:hypothetical protein